MRTIEHKNIPSRGGGGGFNQVLIQVQLIHSLPFVTTMKEKNTTTTKNKIPYPFLNAVCYASRVENWHGGKQGEQFRHIIGQELKTTVKVDITDV